MDENEKNCIFPPISLPRKLKYLGSSKPFSKKDDEKGEIVTLRHALFEIDSAYNDIKQSLNNFKYELENGRKKSDFLKEYSGLIEEIHDEVPLLRGNNIYNSSTVGDFKIWKEQSSHERRITNTYKEWFRGEKEGIINEDKFIQNHEKNIKKELEKIYDLDEEIKKVTESLRKIKRDSLASKNINLCRKLSLSFKKMSNTKILNVIAENENDDNNEQTVNYKPKVITEIKNEKELEENWKYKDHCKDVKCPEGPKDANEKNLTVKKADNSNFINRNIQLAKNYYNNSTSLTDEEKSKLETLLNETENKNSRKIGQKYQSSEKLETIPEDQVITLDNTQVIDEGQEKCQKNPTNCMVNAFKLLEEEKKAIDEIDGKLSNVNDKEVQENRQKIEQDEISLKEDEKLGKLWKIELLQRRFEEIDQQLAKFSVDVDRLQNLDEEQNIKNQE